MEVSRIRALRGPSIWGRQTVLEAIVACADHAQVVSKAAGFHARLHNLFPDIEMLLSTPPDDGGAMAHALAFVALRLQVRAGCPVAFSRSVATNQPRVFQVVVEYSEEEVGRVAFDLAQALCAAAMNDTAFDLAGALAQLRDLNEDLRLGPSTGSIVQAAVARAIPYRRLTQGSTVQFGWGNKQRRIQAAETDSTSAIAESIAQDKVLTKRLLAAAGVPVPNGRVVHSADEAWEAAEAIGSAVVVKPSDGNQGKGVTVNLAGREQVLAAYENAVQHGSAVIVERYFPGHDFRLLVVGDNLVAAARRDPPHVIGDGQHSIVQLVEAINADPARGEGHASSLTRIQLDGIALAMMQAQGYRPDSVLEQGALVILRNNANLSTGGTATDVTDHVHPDLAATAVAAAKMVGLDVCGVDMVGQNVFEPLDQQQGCIVEVNAAPGLRMHLSPSSGVGRPVGESIIAHMFPGADNGRIPVVAVTGTNGKTTTVRLIAHLLASTGRCVGMTNSDGVYIDSERIDSGDCSGPRSARKVLLHPDVQAAVFEAARGGILREGLGFDRCDVAVVTNIGFGDHLSMDFISTAEELAKVKRVVVESVGPEGMAVLNAADPLVAAMASSCLGGVTFFAMDANHPVLATHRAQGRRVVWAEGGHIVLAEGGFERRIALASIALTRNGSIGFQIENAMASIAAVWALGLDWSSIEAGLSSFVSDAQTTPGRFNVFSYKGATLIADYGHNPDAISALVQAVNAMPAKKRSVVISGAGDRRDIDIRRQTEILGDAFDEAILFQDQCQRGRADGEVLTLLREGLVNARRTTRTSEVYGEFTAIDQALNHLSEGDLCLILVDQVEEALAHIAQRVAQTQT